MSSIPVTGELYVQSRTGSSVLDWKDETTPPGPYLADPDKVRKVVATLDAADIDVTGVSSCAVQWSGPIEAVRALFGLDLEMGVPAGAPKGAGPRWYPKKPGLPQIFDLSKTGQWGALAGGLCLTRGQPEADARTGDPVGPGNPPLPQDLLLGEAADAMRPGGPSFDAARLAAFPTPLELKSTAANRSRRDAVRSFVPTRQVIDTPNLVTTTIVESGLDLEMVDTWKQLDVIPKLGPALLHAPASGLLSTVDKGYARRFATAYFKERNGRPPPVWAFINLFDALAAATQPRAKLPADDWMERWNRALINLQPMLDDLPLYVDYINAARRETYGPTTHTWPTEWAGPALPPAVKALAAALGSVATTPGGMAAVIGDPAVGQAVAAAANDINLLRWGADFLTWLRRSQHRSTHAALATSGFLAITGGLLPVLVRASRRGRQYSPPALGVREVRTRSASARNDFDFDNEADRCLTYKRARFAELQHSGFLICQSSGNSPAPGEPRYGRMENLLAHHPRVLVVGGAVWDGGVLKASSATLGFSTDIKPSGGEKPFSLYVPTLCATTASPQGGALISPKKPGQPGNYSWRELGGSSVATPQVAGLCALAWWIDPEMSAEDLRKLVLANTIPFGPNPGSWHEPFGVDLGSSDAATHPGAKVPDLEGTLRAAEKNARSRLSGPMRTAWWTAKKAR